MVTLVRPLNAPIHIPSLSFSLRDFSTSSVYNLHEHIGIFQARKKMNLGEDEGGGRLKKKEGNEGRRVKSKEG